MVKHRNKFLKKWKPTINFKLYSILSFWSHFFLKYFFYIYLDWVCVCVICDCFVYFWISLVKWQGKDSKISAICLHQPWFLFGKQWFFSLLKQRMEIFLQILFPKFPRIFTISKTSNKCFGIFARISCWTKNQYKAVKIWNKGRLPQVALPTSSIFFFLISHLLLALIQMMLYETHKIRQSLNNEKKSLN